ncbi:hypothetical protein [Streptomyces sp. NPDC001536]|uniref:hypothetical protein n=1 Tax=Streptomyces sp. NPDC001536 TaxID=3364583 RepID=UPI00368C6CEB
MHTAPLTEEQTAQLGEAVGRIAVFAARSLTDTYPHLDRERLLELFLRPVAVDATAALYMAALDRGARPGEAAGEAGAALIRGWAEARLQAREETAGREGEG